MDVIKDKRLFVEFCRFAHALVFPCGDIRKIIIVTFGFVFIRLVLFAEVTAARFVTVQRVLRHQFTEFEEVGDAVCFLDFRIVIIRSARDADILPELFAQLGKLNERFVQSGGVASHADKFPHDSAELTVNLIDRAFALELMQRFGL